MNKNKWSGYAKYLVLASKEVINNIAFSDKSTYSSSGDIYIRKITSSEAKNILDNIEECKWTSTTAKIILVANQLKIRI